VTGPITVAVATDTAYLPWTATLLRSLVDAAPGESYDAHVLTDGSLHPEDRARLATVMPALTIHDIDPVSIAGLPTTESFGSVVWLRSRIPELLPGATRAIYLDADTFVATSLRPLFDASLDGHPLGAVANVVEPEARQHVRDLGIAYPGGLFNSGVLLLDLERLRAERAADVLAEAAGRRQGIVRWPDQEALNIVFAGRWAPLHPRWNAQNSLWLWPDWAEEVFGAPLRKEAMDAPGIRHFEGPSLSKPWHFLCPYPGARAYRAALARTPWAGTPLEDRTPATMLLRALPTRARIWAYRRLLAARSRRRS
jgi:lipopolysaccharide biosynthesis glycosyltransferase